MALLYDATLTPSKMTLVRGWLPDRPWFQGEGKVRKLGAYRFDDPAGEVGIETILWRTDDGTVLQVPFTYRAAPLDGADEFLVGTTDHSALGPRWVYDGCGDPVWAAAMAEAILTGGTQAQMVIEREGQLVDVPARMQVRGSGSDLAPVPEVTSVDSVTDGPVTQVVAGPLVLTLARVVGAPVAGDATLTGTVGDDPTVHTLAALR
jgi:Maltokinase N-terminal cap domain